MVKVYDVFQAEAITQNSSKTSDSLRIDMMQDIYGTIIFEDTADDSADITVTYQLSIDEVLWSAEIATDLTDITVGNGLDGLTIGVAVFIRFIFTENDAGAATINAKLAIR